MHLLNQHSHILSLDNFSGYRRFKKNKKAEAECHRNLANINQMDGNQLQSLYQSVAISSWISPNPAVPVTAQQRNEAFLNLEEFKKYEKRVVACIELLQAENHILSHPGNPPTDITIPTKLYALDILQQFIKKNYSKINESERLALRSGVLTAARQLAVSSDNLTSEAIQMGAGEGARILGMKIAAVIADFAVRDFPQRWNSFITDVFVPQEQGGIWGSSNPKGEQEGSNLMLGVKMGLECLKIITENCTDSDFNSKVSKVYSIFFYVTDDSPDIPPSEILRISFFIIPRFLLLVETTS